MKNFIILSASLIASLLFSNLLLAHEIHLKDGRIIEAESVWEEDNKVFYEKHGATVEFDKTKVKEIIYKKEISKGKSTGSDREGKSPSTVNQSINYNELDKKARDVYFFVKKYHYLPFFECQARDLNAFYCSEEEYFFLEIKRALAKGATIEQTIVGAKNFLAKRKRLKGY